MIVTHRMANLEITEGSMPKINMIHHINTQISDRQQTREWYESVLGAEFLDRGPALKERQL